VTLAHWDDVERRRREVGEMKSWWRDLGGAAGSSAVGVQRVEIDPGARIGPVHVHGAEEEIFFVLGGSGLAWLDGAVHEIGALDTIVCPAGGPAHTLIASDEGLDVLAFGENADPPLVHLPRAGVLRRGAFWTLAGTEPGPLEREAAAGPLEIPAPARGRRGSRRSTRPRSTSARRARTRGPSTSSRTARAPSAAACAMPSSRRARTPARRTGTRARASCS
jgi:uncharacterized cupin superfamily protein